MKKEREKRHDKDKVEGQNFQHELDQNDSKKSTEVREGNDMDEIVKRVLVVLDRHKDGQINLGSEHARMQIAHEVGALLSDQGDYKIKK